MKYVLLFLTFHLEKFSKKCLELFSSEQNKFIILTMVNAHKLKTLKLNKAFND